MNSESLICRAFKTSIRVYSPYEVVSFDVEYPVFEISVGCGFDYIGLRISGFDYVPAEYFIEPLIYVVIRRFSPDIEPGNSCNCRPDGKNRLAFSEVRL